MGMSRRRRGLGLQVVMIVFLFVNVALDERRQQKKCWAPNSEKEAT